MTPTELAVPLRQDRARAAPRRLEHEQVRVPYRKRDRGGGHRAHRPGRVPVLVLDGQAICDSKRIVEHLEWRAKRPSAPASTPGTSGSA